MADENSPAPETSPEPEAQHGRLRTWWKAYTAQHNEGNDDNKRAAMQVITAYCTAMLTVAVGTLALTVAFLNNLPKPRSVWALEWGWGLLIFSVVCALAAMGQQVNLLAENDLRPRHGFLEFSQLFGWLALVIGLIFVAWFGVHNISLDGSSDKTKPPCCQKASPTPTCTPTHGSRPHPSPDTGPRPTPKPDP